RLRGARRPARRAAAESHGAGGAVAGPRPDPRNAGRGPARGGTRMVTEELEVVNRPQAEDTAPRGLLAALVDRLIGPFRRGKVPEHRPAMGFYTDTTVCIGCKACEVACKQWNQLPADGFTFTG